MFSFNKAKKVHEISETEDGRTLTIPHWMLVESGLDIHPRLLIEYRHNSILIRGLGEP